MRRFKFDLTIFTLLTLLVVTLQYFILKPHLRYGFADVDWMFLLDFKQLSLDNHNPISHLINGWKKWGVYTYQIYYIGLIEHFFGFNYQNFQIVTHIFKAIATLSIFPLILIITKSRLTAFLTTLIYAVAYPSVGVMYTVVTSGLFVAIPFMTLFLIWYWYIVNKIKNNFLDIFIVVILLLVTLFLSTERMYPLIPVIILIEFYWWFKNNYSKIYLFQAIKRLSTFILIFLALFLYRPSIFTAFFGNTQVTYLKFSDGNWQVILSPLISLGSLFVAKDYWRIFGTPSISSFSSYIFFLFFGPLLIFTIFTSLLSILLSSKPTKFILNTLVPFIILSLVTFILANHHLSIPESARMHFDLSYVVPTLIGMFTISFTFALFKEWLDFGRENNQLISMVGGVVIAFIFIVMTWLAADWVLVFYGVHRYLTIPAIGSSLLIAGLVTIVFNKLRVSRFTRGLSYLIFLLLIPLIMFNAKVIGDYFKYELEYAGTDAAGHIRMKNKLWSYLDNFNNTEPSVFYFDESQDYDNGYFDETTIMAGFNFWMRFRGREIVDAKLTPALLRSNLICPEPRSMCLNKVKSLVTTQNGVKGILYGDKFYTKENFYAFRFINRDIVDIKTEVIGVIGLD